MTARGTICWTDDDAGGGEVALVPVLLVVACLSAGVYGALLYQTSFTVRPTDIHDLKFDQFGLFGRLGAAIVGWPASWWMGVLLSPPLIVAAWFASGPFTMGMAFLRSLLAVAAATFVLALCVLGLAWTFRSGAGRFELAATMNEARYLGSGLGVLMGLAVTFRTVLRGDRALRIVDTRGARS